jgi:hypothetical protein
MEIGISDRMNIAVSQINPSRLAVREKARHAAPLASATAVKPAPEGPGDGVRFGLVSIGRRTCAALVLLSLAGCRSGEVAPPPPAPSASAAEPGAPVRNKAELARDGKPPFASAPWHIPVGPDLEIVPGKGFGPIRFGAKVETIERLMGEPCEEKRVQGEEVVCRYSAQAVEFVLRKDQVVQMRAHRLGRPFKTEPKPDFGIFKGRFTNGVSPGMLPAAVRELLGAPKRVAPVSGDNPNQTVEVYEYDTFALEFDRLPSGSEVLGGIILNAPS